jgi:hypothetical protein
MGARRAQIPLVQAPGSVHSASSLDRDGSRALLQWCEQAAGGCTRAGLRCIQCGGSARDRRPSRVPLGTVRARPVDDGGRSSCQRRLLTLFPLPCVQQRTAVVPASSCAGERQTACRGVQRARRAGAVHNIVGEVRLDLAGPSALRAPANWRLDDPLQARQLRGDGDTDPGGGSLRPQLRRAAAAAAAAPPPPPRHPRHPRRPHHAVAQQRHTRGRTGGHSQ